MMNNKKRIVVIAAIVIILIALLCIKCGRSTGKEGKQEILPRFRALKQRPRRKKRR